MPKRVNTQERRRQRQELYVCAKYYMILRDMFEHFRDHTKPRPWPWGDTQGQPYTEVMSLRGWAQRWAKELHLSPGKVTRYLQTRGHAAITDAILFLLGKEQVGGKR